MILRPKIAPQKSCLMRYNNEFAYLYPIDDLSQSRSNNNISINTQWIFINKYGICTYNKFIILNWKIARSIKHIIQKVNFLLIWDKFSS